MAFCRPTHSVLCSLLKLFDRMSHFCQGFLPVHRSPRDENHLPAMDVFPECFLPYETKWLKSHDIFQCHDRTLLDRVKLVLVFIQEIYLSTLEVGKSCFFPKGNDSCSSSESEIASSYP